MMMSLEMDMKILNRLGELEKRIEALEPKASPLDPGFNPAKDAPITEELFWSAMAMDEALRSIILVRERLLLAIVRYREIR